MKKIYVKYLILKAKLYESILNDMILAGMKNTPMFIYIYGKAYYLALTFTEKNIDY